MYFLLQLLGLAFVTLLLILLSNTHYTWFHLFRSPSIPVVSLIASPIFILTVDAMICLILCDFNNLILSVLFHEPSLSCYSTFGVPFTLNTYVLYLRPESLYLIILSYIIYTIYIQILLSLTILVSCSGRTGRSGCGPRRSSRKLLGGALSTSAMETRPPAAGVRGGWLAVNPLFLRRSDSIFRRNSGEIMMNIRWILLKFRWHSGEFWWNSGEILEERAKQQESHKKTTQPPQTFLAALFPSSPCPGSLLSDQSRSVSPPHPYCLQSTKLGGEERFRGWTEGITYYPSSRTRAGPDQPHGPHQEAAPVPAYQKQAKGPSP